MRLSSISLGRTKTGAKPVGQSLFFKAIPWRQCTRNAYDTKPVPTADLHKLITTATGAVIRPMVFTGAAAMDSMLQYVNAGNDRQMTDDKFKRQLTDWIWFSTGEAVSTRDGLSSRVMGNPTIPRWLAKWFIGGQLNPEAATDKDDKFIRSSSGLVPFVSAGNDTTARIETGRAYKRFALLATAMNIKNAFMNQPCEVSALRAQRQSHLNLNGAFPQLLCRFGHSPAMPKS